MRLGKNKNTQDFTEFKNVIETARSAKGYTQRDLAEKVGVRQSTYNDTINGKTSKVDVGLVSKIADELDLSLRDLLSLIGYDDVSLWFENKIPKSKKDYLKQLDKCKEFKYDILDWDAKKRQEAINIMDFIGQIKLQLKLIKIRAEENKYTLDDVIKELDDVVEQLKPIAEKYDYSKLPEDI